MDHEIIIRIVFTDTILKYMFIDVDDNDYNISDIENINSSADINLLSDSSYKGYYEYEYINDNINFTDYVGILGHLRDNNNNIIFHMFNFEKVNVFIIILIKVIVYIYHLMYYIQTIM